MENNIKEIELVNYLKYKIKISDKFIEKKEKRIYFDDVISVRCRTWRQHASYFGAKAYHGQFNRILILDNKKNKLDLSFSSISEESFQNFLHIVSAIVGPLANNISRKIKSGQEVEISNLLLTQNGIYKKGLFGKKFIDWQDCARVVVDRGHVDIFRSNGKRFSSAHIWKENAIVLPELVKYFK